MSKTVTTNQLRTLVKEKIEKADGVVYGEFPFGEETFVASIGGRTHASREISDSVSKLTGARLEDFEVKDRVVFFNMKQRIDKPFTADTVLLKKPASPKPGTKYTAWSQVSLNLTLRSLADQLKARGIEVISETTPQADNPRRKRTEDRKMK